MLFRSLSDQAIRDASTVGSKSFDAGSGGGLYVHRDLEHAVLHALASSDLVVVSGDAGSGKTSLLWGLARRLLEHEQPPDVYFLKASYLLGTSDALPLVSAESLVEAIHARSLAAESIVFVDTADLLVNDQRAFDVLMDLIERVRASHGRVVVTSRPAEALLITAGRSAPQIGRAHV